MLTFLAFISLFVGLLMVVFSLLSLVVQGFKASVGWGIAMLIGVFLCPVVPVWFALTHWRLAGGTFITLVVGFVLMSLSTYYLNDWILTREILDLDAIREKLAPAEQDGVGSDSVTP